MRQCIIEAWAHQPGTPYFVREYSVTTGFLERIELKREILVIRRDADIPYGHSGGAVFLCGATPARPPGLDSEVVIALKQIQQALTAGLNPPEKSGEAAHRMAACLVR